MDLEVSFDCNGVDWAEIADTLERVGMASFAPEVHRRAFENSRVTVFIRREGRLVGFGRAMSDGAYQAAVYDCAVCPEFQGQGMGSLIMDHILSQVPNCNVILYAAPGKEGFYAKQGFRRMKTGMARFVKEEAMTEKGFTE